MDEREIRSIVQTVVEQLQPVPEIKLKCAMRLAEKVKAKAKEMGVNAVIAVSNRSANPILVECMDDSYIASYDIAVNKAFTVVSLKMPTSRLKELAQPGGSLYGIQFTHGGKIVIFGGGEVLTDGKGNIVGGLGVSGGTEEQDTALALYGKQIFENSGGN